MVRTAVTAAALAVAALAAFGAARHAAAATGDGMVVVATTAPTVERGRMVAGGERLDLPAGATVTLLGPDGRTLTLEGPDPVVPAGAGEAEGGRAGGVLATLASLLGVGGPDGDGPTVLAAVRSARACPSGDGLPPTERIARLAERGCVAEARAALDALVVGAAPAALYLAAGDGGGRRPAVYRIGEPLRLQAQANFDGYLYCYYQTSDGTVFPIFPREAGAAAARIPGNRPFALPGDMTVVEPSGTEAVACYATGRDVRGDLPPAAAGPPFRPLPADVAARLPSLFRGLGAAPYAEARLVVDIVP